MCFRYHVLSFSGVSLREIITGLSWIVLSPQFFELTMHRIFPKNKTRKYNSKQKVSRKNKLNHYDSRGKYYHRFDDLSCMFWTDFSAEICPEAFWLIFLALHLVPLTLFFHYKLKLWNAFCPPRTNQKICINFSKHQISKKYFLKKIMKFFQYYIILTRISRKGRARWHIFCLAIYLQISTTEYI